MMLQETQAAKKRASRAEDKVKPSEKVTILMLASAFSMCSQAQEIGGIWCAGQLFGQEVMTSDVLCNRGA